MTSLPSLPAVTVGYWAIRGLAAPLRMMVMYSGHKLHNAAYEMILKPESTAEALQWDGSAWFTAKPDLV